MEVVDREEKYLNQPVGRKVEIYKIKELTEWI